MKRIVIAVILLLAAGADSIAQLRYPVVGTFRNLSAQGMAIYGDNAYLLNDTGLCRVYSLMSKSVTQTFPLACAGDIHANAACFGVETPEGGTMPALYVSGCSGEGICFVENVFDERSETVQTIRYVSEGKSIRVVDWAVDGRNDFLYGIIHGPGGELDELGTLETIVLKFRLPRLGEGHDIIFTENDLLDSFSVFFPNILQGAQLRGRYLYIVTGLQETYSYQKKSGRAIKVVDLRKRKLTRSVDLTYLTTNEPEDLDFHGRTPLLYCGQEGGLYEVRLR